MLSNPNNLHIVHTEESYKMKKTIVCVFLLLSSVSSEVIKERNVTDLCENSGCFCQINDEQSDFPYVDIDCSFNEVSFFVGEYVLPDHVNLLDLSANNFTTLDIVSDILRSPTMKRLFLNRNLITAIVRDFFDLPGLTYLDLSDNQLETIDPIVFVKLKALKYLNLASNKFKTFSPGNFKNLNVLEVLILDDNAVGEHLTEVSLFQDIGLALNPKIEALSLESVGIRDIPENFLVEAYNLRHLRLSRNSLTVIPELPFTMEYLDLSDNAIAEIDADDFSNMPALKELMLNSLNIDEIPEYTFASLRALKKLELKGNRRMNCFNRLAFGQEVLDDADDLLLEELSFRGSLLTTLHEDLMEPFSRLRKLDLQGNPWMCDCRLVWIKKLRIPEEDADHIRCFRPMQLFNSRLMEAQERSFVCRSRYSDLQRVIAYIIVGLVLILVGMALWLFFIMPKYNTRKNLIQNMVSPNSPYSRITIEPNAAEDYR